jgi:hypothetical protein
MEGSDKDGGAVLFKDFRQFLDNVAVCLRRVQRRTGSGRIRYRIADLKSGSAVVKLEAVSPAKSPTAAREVYDTFSRTVSALAKGTRPDPRLRPDDLKPFRKLAEPVLKGEKKIVVAGTTLTTRYVAHIDDILGGWIPSKGTVKGRVEQLNVHERHEFTLFPPIEGYSIRCVFPEPLLETVRKSIKRNVTVYGALSFRKDNPYPARVRVNFIEIHPPDDELPTLASLKGMMPGATDGKTPVEFVKALRDG